eukprot:3331158-Prymnesium_polylepis.1
MRMNVGVVAEQIDVMHVFGSFLCGGMGFKTLRISNAVPAHIPVCVRDSLVRVAEDLSLLPRQAPQAFAGTP